MTRALVAMTCVMAVVIAITLWLHTIVTPADVMIHYAQDAVDYAQKHHQIELDYSESSIEALETMVDKMRERNLSDDALALYAKMWGGYFGEVIRRQHGGVWSQPAAGALAGAYVLETKGTQLAPPSKVYARLKKGEDRLGANYELLLREWSR